MEKLKNYWNEFLEILEKKEDGIYEVKVINNDANLTEIARYTVNVKTGAVTE